MIHTLNNHDITEVVSSIFQSVPGPAVSHALECRSAVSMGDYPLFFRLYHQAPNMSGYLMEHFLDKFRLTTFQKLCKAYRPHLAIDFFAVNLGFVPPGLPTSKKHLRDAFAWIRFWVFVIGRECGVEVVKGEVDCKVAYGIVNQRLMQIQMKGVNIKGQIH